MSRVIVLICGLLGAAGVAVGAYGAHGLEKSLLDQEIPIEDIAKRLEQCDVAVQYHMIHVVALLAMGLAVTHTPKRRIAASILFLLGIGMFCGGLYSMVFLGQMGHWAIVPSGGLCFMLGWLVVASLALSKDASPSV